MVTIELTDSSLTSLLIGVSVCKLLTILFTILTRVWHMRSADWGSSYAPVEPRGFSLSALMMVSGRLTLSMSSSVGADSFEYFEE